MLKQSDDALLVAAQGIYNVRKIIVGEQPNKNNLNHRDHDPNPKNN